MTIMVHDIFVTFNHMVRSHYGLGRGPWSNRVLRGPGLPLNAHISEMEGLFSALEWFY